MRCRVCNGLLERVEAPALRGRCGDVEVEVFGLRPLGCPVTDHPLEPPTPDFAADLMAAVAAGRTLPCAAERGWPRKRTACGRCGGALREPGPGRLQARVRLPGAAPFTLTVDGPVAVCAACGGEQQGSGDVRTRTAEAVLDALRAGGVGLGQRAPGEEETS